MNEEIKLNYHFYDDSNLNDRKREKIFNYLNKQKVLSLDIETTRKYNKYGKIEGLDPYTSDIVMFQIGNEQHQFIFDYRKVSISFLNEILTNKKIEIVGHNIKFEYKHILHNEGIRINNLYDTMIAEAILNIGYYPELGLKAVIKKYLNIEIEKDTRLEFLNILNKYFNKRQKIYGAKDILYPLFIRRKQLSIAEDNNLLNTFDLEFKFIEVLGDIEYKGLNFDKNRWLNLYNRNLKIFETKLYNLDQFVLKNYFYTDFVNKQLDMFSEGFNCRIEWTSSKQVIEFFKYLKICPQEISKTTKKLSYTVEAKVLKASLNTINKNIPDKLKGLLKLYIEFKEIEQSVTTFGKQFLKYVNPITGRLHSNYKQILNTGRISSSGPK